MPILCAHNAPRQGSPRAELNGYQTKSKFGSCWPRSAIDNNVAFAGENGTLNPIALIELASCVPNHPCAHLSYPAACLLGRKT